jgi:hypothetical protein
MDRVEKIDCGANGEVIVHTKRPPLSQSPKTCDLISQRTEMKGARKEVRYPMIHDENRELS